MTSILTTPARPACTRKRVTSTVLPSTIARAVAIGSWPSSETLLALREVLGKRNLLQFVLIETNVVIILVTNYYPTIYIILFRVLSLSIVIEISVPRFYATTPSSP